MSTSKRQPPSTKPHHPASQNNAQIAGCYWNMGQTSEEVSRRYHVEREKQDYYVCCCLLFWFFFLRGRIFFFFFLIIVFYFILPIGAPLSKKSHRGTTKRNFR